MLLSQIEELEPISNVVLRHGLSAVLLGIVLGAFLWGIRYLMTIAVPTLINGIREDHAQTLRIFREEQAEDRKLYRELLARIEQRWESTSAAIVLRLDQICCRLEKLEKGVEGHAHRNS